MYRDKYCQHCNLQMAAVETVINQGLLVLGRQYPSMRNIWRKNET